MAARLKIGIVFGGRSGEHEISLLSARNVLDALDPARYEPVLLGIDPEGRWHLGDAGRALLEPPGSPLRLDAGTPALAVAPGAGRRSPRAPGPSTSSSRCSTAPTA